MELGKRAWSFTDGDLPPSRYGILPHRRLWCLSMGGYYGK